MSDTPKTAIRIASITESTSRRDAIKVGLAALAGMGLTALAPKEAFAAAGGNFILGVSNDAGTADTALTSATGGHTLRLANTDSTFGSFLYGVQNGGSSYGAAFDHTGSGVTLQLTQSGTGHGLYSYTTNTSNNSPMVHGRTRGGTATAILGETESTHANARGVRGSTAAGGAAGCAVEGATSGSGGATGVWGNVGAGGTGSAVKGTNAGTGSALVAEVTNAVSTALAASVTTAGAGECLKAQNTNAANSNTVITGQTNGNGYAIYGYSTSANASQATILGNSVSTHVNARGVWGNLAAGNTNGYGVEGRTFGHGGGVVAAAVNPSDGVGLYAYNSGTGSAIRAEIANAASNATAVRIANPGLGAGLTVETTNVSNGGGAVQITHAGTNQAVLATSSNTGATQPTIVANSASTDLGARGVRGNLTDASAMGYGVEGTTAGTGGGGVLAKASAPGTAFGLHAVSTGAGSAARIQITNSSNSQPALVAVTNGTGCAIQAEGGRAQLYLKPATAAGAPAAGAHLLGEIFMDAAGALYTCTTAGTPGLWTRLAAAPSNVQSNLTDSTTDYLLHTSQTGTGRSIEAWIDNSSNASSALHAKTAGSGCAIEAEGGRAQLYLKPQPTAGAPATGAHLLGEVFMDAAGTLYTCVAAGTPGTWLPLAVNSGPISIHDGANAAAVAIQSPSATSYAVKAQGSAANGRALRVEGIMTMTRSGKAKIPKGKSTVYVTVPGGLTTSASILCTLQGSAGTNAYIRYSKRVSATRFKIVLSKASAYTTYAGWMVLG